MVERPRKVIVPSLDALLDLSPYPFSRSFRGRWWPPMVLVVSLYSLCYNALYGACTGLQRVCVLLTF